jgi:Ca-activated chloride channel homolog
VAVDVLAYRLGPGPGEQYDISSMTSTFIKSTFLFWVAVAIFLAATAGFTADAQDEGSQATIKTEVALVNVIFSAVDGRNRPIPDLKAIDFTVFEDGNPQKVQYFADLTRESDIPLTIALLIDTSGSVKTKLDDEETTAAQFFKDVVRKQRDLALIIQFDSEVNLVQDFTDDPNSLIRALSTLRAGNTTSLYDAIYLAVNEKLKGEVGRKVIVVITDGDDTSSNLSLQDAIEAAQRNDVIIYGIGVRGELGAKFGVLKRFAEETGGSFFSPHPRISEIQASFKAISQELQGQYSLAYDPANKKRDGAFRSIDLRCKLSGVRIRARKGYYAPKKD